jgi:hypothetical protein
MNMSVQLTTLKNHWVAFALCVGAAVCVFLAGVSDSFAATIRQQKFTSAEEAVRSFVKALRADDEKNLLTILGPGSKALLSSGDEVADKNGREKFLSSFDRNNLLERKSGDTVVLHVGEDNWALPIPIVKKGGHWSFDTQKGKKKILERRIGRNELNVIKVLDAYVDAQQEYATKDCRGNGKVEFAEKLISSPGKRDGLYWEAKEGEQQSPLGPLVAQAAKEGYAKERSLAPFHGYYYRILTGQGKHAEGGAYRYLVDGKMLLGFALVAYPAEYGNSGVMTFIVNQEGTIYEKDLGRNTRRNAEAMRSFNPDKSWKPVKPDDEHSKKP